MVKEEKEDISQEEEDVHQEQQHYYHSKCCYDAISIMIISTKKVLNINRASVTFVIVSLLQVSFSFALSNCLYVKDNNTFL